MQRKATPEVHPGHAEGELSLRRHRDTAPSGLRGPALLAVAGYHIFNGDGTGKDVLSATINGQSIEHQLSNPDRSEYDITYTVNA